MAKAKDKPAPQRRSKITEKAPKQAPSKASRLSKEYVVDSEDEDAPSEEKKVKKVVSQFAPVSASKSASASKAKQNDATSTVKDASESEEDKSGSEEPSEDEVSGSEVGKEVTKVPAGGAPAKMNGVKRTASEASSASEESSSEEEEEEDSDEEVAEPAAKRSRTDTDAERRPSFAGSGTGVGERSTPVAAASRKEAAAQDAVSGPIPAKPYQPPSGYTALDISTVRHSDSFASSALNGKQIWHITAPSDISLASIREVAADAILSGKPVLNHRGTDYVLSEADAGGNSTIVFVPGKENFMPLEQRVEKTFQLQQHIVLPNLSHRQASGHTGSTAAAKIAQAPVTSIRPQPKGLRMRYRPPGYGDGDTGTIGSESDSGEQDEGRQAQKTFQFPRALGAHGASETPAEPNGPAVNPKKKRKEKQRDPIAESPMANGRSHNPSTVAEASHQDGVTASAAATPANKVVAPETVNGDVIMTDTAELSKLGKDDKARRKEGKRLKKEAKMKGRAS